ncbi:MAG: hypothetical protein [Caudoviricetes sp.]|nr:MAG: hypothetical protein [Caudoviricetes sp.]
MEKYDPNKPHEYDAYFQQAADTHGVSYALLRKVGWVESRFNPKAVSPTKPRGVMQFTKATGNAYGLVTDEDFFDPQKSIDAGARHLKDLVARYDGDELKAALAYNQGGGRIGRKQLEAYDKGDYASISNEGRNYLKQFMDVANSPNKGKLEVFGGGITPTTPKVPFEDATGGIGKAPKVSTELPQSHGFRVEGIEQAPKQEVHSKSFFDKHRATMDEVADRSTWFGFGSAVDAEVSNSVAGVAYRAGRIDNGFDIFTDVMQPTRLNTHIWSKEELDKIRSEVKNPHYINTVLGGSSRNLDELIKLANENYELDSKAADAGLGAKLSAGVIGAAFDPLSYVPLIGQSGKGFKLINKAMVVGAQSAGLSMASEGLRTYVAGGEAHYAQAALGGFVFGAGMSAIIDGIGSALRRANPNAPEVVNDIQPAVTRMEARETAINANSEDLSRMPPSEERVFDHNHNGVDYALHPTEEGAVILKDGSILSDTNPLNPQTLKEFAEAAPDKSNMGVKMFGLTEISQKLSRSDTPEIRGIAQDLVRPTTGMKDGSAGKFGATASDIKERLHYTDQQRYNDLNTAMRDAMNDPEWTSGGVKMSKEAARQEIYKRAALAIERPELQADLTKGERKVMDLIKEHFDTKRELMENPAIFGNEKATSIFPNSRHKGTYVPNVYSREAKTIYANTLGGTDGLQKAISESWLISYRSRPEVKKRVDEYLAEVNNVNEVTPEMVNQYAMNKAYGIAKTDEFSSSSVIDDNITGLVGIENNSFLEARHLFDSDLPTTLPNGQQFSVNDLRDFDMKYLMPAYDRRVNGDVAIMGGTGMTTKELKDVIMQLDSKAEGKGTMKGEVEALKDTVKIITGRARRNQDTMFDTATRSLSDLSFFAKNAYMGLQNLTEIAGMIAKGNTKALLHNIPFVRNLAFKKSPVSGKELKELHNVMFGKDLDDLIRPRRRDIVQRLRESTDTPDMMAQAVGTMKFATQELAARSPWTKMLNGTSNALLDAGRQGLLGDVISHTLSNKKSKFGTDVMLNSASITKSQWEGIKNLIRENVTQGENGQYTIKDKQAFAKDPRAMDLWRMADKVADETMLRPYKVSLQDAKAFGAGAKMFLQFKSFTIKSVNSKFARSIYDAQHGRAVDSALTWSVGMGLAAAYYVGAAHLKALGLPKHEQKDYLKRTLDPKLIATAGLLRSSTVGAPFSLAGMVAAPFGFDVMQDVRSTVLPRTKSEREAKPIDGFATGSDLMQDFYTRVSQQVPAMGFISNAAGSVYNAANVAKAPNKPTERDFMTALMNTTRELVPNDPLTQQLLIKFYEEQGVHTKSKK